MKIKKPTVRFYTEDGIYKGWQYVYTVSYREARNWLLSGNYLKIGNKVYNPFSTTTLLTEKIFG